MMAVRSAALSLFVAVAVAALAPARAADNAAGDLRYAGDFRYQIATGVSAYELWYSSEDLILSPTGAVIRYFKFDWESAPRDQGWIVQGVVLAGTSDSGTTPVAVRLWSRERSRLQTELSRDLSAERGRAIAIFTPSLATCTDETTCTGQAFQISATREGDVFVGTTKIGTIK